MTVSNGCVSAENALRQDQDWASPLLWRSEFRNVLAAYLRRKLMVLDTAVQIMEQAESLLKKREYSVSSFLKSFPDLTVSLKSFSST